MADYLYDDSFSGFLTVIFQLYKNKSLEASIYRESLYEDLLFSSGEMIYTDHALAERVMKGILDQLGEEWLDALYRVFLSEMKDCDTIGFNALKLAFKNGRHLINDERHPQIQSFLKLSRKVSRECHSFLGYIRFSKLESGLFYSQFEPSYNILPLLAPHFADRLKDQSWVIYDSKRKIAAFYDQNNWYLNPLEESGLITLAQDEIEIQSLWRGYFESLAISERKNLKLQQQKIPKKYWQFFTEDIGVLKQHAIMK